MHRSRLAGFIIDCQDADLDAAATFWSAALAFPKGQTEGSYIYLDGRRFDADLIEARDGNLVSLSGGCYYFSFSS